MHAYIYARACLLLGATVSVQAVQKSGSVTNSIQLIRAIAEHKSNSNTYPRLTRSNLYIVNSNSSLTNIKITIKIPKNHKKSESITFTIISTFDRVPRNTLETSWYEE